MRPHILKIYLESEPFYAISTKYHSSPSYLHFSLRLLRLPPNSSLPHSCPLHCPHPKLFSTQKPGILLELVSSCHFPVQNSLGKNQNYYCLLRWSVLCSNLTGPKHSVKHSGCAFEGVFELSKTYCHP